MKILLTDALRHTLQSDRGVMDPSPFEARRAARFRCNGKAVALLLESRIFSPIQEKEAIVIVRDVSRTGLGLLSHQQWFPEQMIRVTLDDSTVDCRIARTRRVGTRCYEVGVEILKYVKSDV